MTRKNLLRAMACGVLAATAGLAGSGASQLGVGDKAPPLELRGWVHGEPVRLPPVWPRRHRRGGT